MWFNLGLFLIFLIGGVLRFFKLDWGEGYFFHPDEYHIALSVDQLSFPHQMNPHFFAYGSFIIYLIYFTKLAFSSFNPILIGRFYAALFSTLTLVLLYLIGRRLFSRRYSLLATVLCATLPGLIQQAHFATPESILIFWLFLTLYLGIRWLETKKLKFLYFSSISLGLALGTKIVALTFIPLLLFFGCANQPPRIIKQIIFPLLIVFLVFFSVFPYSFIDWPAFYHSMRYEGGVARGKPVVFYTRQFIKTPPFVFQFKKIFPYALGPGVFLLGILGFFEVLRKITSKNSWLIITLAFLSLFLPNGFLFAKWTRFMAPTFPFFVLFSLFFFKKHQRNKPIFMILSFLLVIQAIWFLMFFSIYLRPDVRIATTSWINSNLSRDSFILTEAGNMLEVPLTGNFQKFSFDFYHLDEDPYLQKQLPDLLAKADYFIIQSRRIFSNHQRLPELFPQTARFYELLFSGKLGFKEIKEFNSFPQLVIGHWRLEIPDELAEETWSVFDHPVIRIYQKIVFFSKEDYEKFFKI